MQTIKKAITATIVLATTILMASPTATQQWVKNYIEKMRRGELPMESQLTDADGNVGTVRLVMSRSNNKGIEISQSNVESLPSGTEFAMSENTATTALFKNVTFANCNEVNKETFLFGTKVVDGETVEIFRTRYTFHMSGGVTLVATEDGGGYVWYENGDSKFRVVQTTVSDLKKTKYLGL